MKNQFYGRPIILMFILLLLLPSLTFAEDNGNKESGQTPIFKEVSIHDPSIIKEGDTYYVFGTHIEAAKSTDLMNWTTFTNGYTTPNNKLYSDLSENLAESFEWAGENDADSKGGFSVWAPEIIWNDSYINDDGTTGAYMMYYSVSSTYMRSAIGYAVSQDIEGPYEYVDTIVYSGFTENEAYDDDSEVNKQWENTNIKELIDDGLIGVSNEKWFHSNGDYNNTTYPNAIDANLFHDENGKLWMTYGSWSGGIFMLEINQETGEAIYPGEDGTTEDGRMIDRYFGTHLAVGHWKSGEGPYVVYDEKSGYYYLYVTYGFLDVDGGYNMRQFRAEKPEGPYLDAAGKDAVLPNDTDNAPYGNKLISNYIFERGPGEPGTDVSYVSPGHNSVYIDPDTDEQFLVFHTRFPNRGEQHEMRVHQMFMNKDDWPVVAPYRYAEETIDKKITEEDVIGEYKYINHQKDNSDKLNHSQLIHFNENQTVSGAVEGTWSKDGHYAELIINNITYDGVFIKQWNPTSESEVITFTALSNEGVSVWGSKNNEKNLTDEEIVVYVKDNLQLGKMNNVVADITLPTEGAYETEITWESSNPEIVSDQGVVNRPDSNSDGTITLTATIRKGDITDTKTFTIAVQPQTEGGLVAYYSFNDNLENDINQGEIGTITGDRVDNTGGTISFEDGKFGQSAVFDGSSGLRLPDGLITSNKYTVSLWLNPEEITDFTTTFFGATSPESWISLVPKGHDGVNHNTMIWSGEEWYDAGLSKQLSVDEWTHVAFTVDEGALAVYFNGVKEFSGTEFPNIFTSAEAVFGLGVNYWDTPYKGLMDELLIYDEQVLSEEEIMTYYRDGTIPGMDDSEEYENLDHDTALSNPVLWLVLITLIIGIVGFIVMKQKREK